MPAPRLLVIADSKMLPALANGLREGARFDVQTVPLSDAAGALAAAEKADAVALFYGAPGSPLPSALQSLSPKVRERGKRIIAVLQREQAAQRDDCFRAGASDLLFMPMPKDQFVARLQGSVELAWQGDGGSQAPVSVATRSASSKVEKAKVSITGVESPSELPLKAGETVRLQWAAFQSWGLVVRGGPSAQIRFAGLAPDEEAQIRDWLKSGAGAAGSAPKPVPVASAAPAVAPPVPPAAPPPAEAAQDKAPPPEKAAAPVAAAPDKPVAPDKPAAQAAPTPPGGSAPVPSAPPAGPMPGGRAAPTAGPPPGFADRKPIRPQTRPPVRVTPPTMSASPGPATPARWTPACARRTAPSASA